MRRDAGAPLWWCDLPLDERGPHESRDEAIDACKRHRLEVCKAAIEENGFARALSDSRFADTRRERDEAIRQANAAQIEADTHKARLHDTQRELNEALAEVERLRQRVAELEAAARWALGESGSFPPREDGQGAYWWRKELRRRAFGGGA